MLSGNEAAPVTYMYNYVNMHTLHMYVVTQLTYIVSKQLIVAVLTNETLLLVFKLCN